MEIYDVYLKNVGMVKITPLTIDNFYDFDDDTLVIESRYISDENKWQDAKLTRSKKQMESDMDNIKETYPFNFNLCWFTKKGSYFYKQDNISVSERNCSSLFFVLDYNLNNNSSKSDLIQIL